MNLSATIEALLFFKGEPLSIKKIAELLHENEEAVRKAITELSSSLQTSSRGLCIVMTDTDVELRTHPDAHSLIEGITKDELSRDLGKAGLETLSIILYKGPVKRSDIDYIRGVSSQYIIRNLLIRGLIERVPDPQDTRSMLYVPTIELLSTLGVNKASDLPEYESVRAEWETRVQQNEESQTSLERGDAQ